MLRPAVLCVGSLVLAGCGNPFFIEGKAAAVCQHLTNQRFQVPSDVRAQVEQLPPELRQGVEVSRVFDFDVSAKVPPELKDMLDSHFALTSIKLTAVEGSTDLGFIDEAHVTLQPLAQSTLEARRFDYVRAEAAPRVVRWNGDAFDVAAYLEAGNLRYLVSLIGSLPQGDVVVDVEACAEVGVKLQYL